MSTRVDLKRREFLQVSAGAALGGGLLVTFGVAGEPVAGEPVAGTPVAGTPAAGFVPNAFVRIDPDGRITLIMPKVEMGQGTYTGHAMLLAEELDVGLDQVRLEASPPSDALYGDALNGGVQMTGTSTAIRYGWEPLRHAGAMTRTLLVNAAARRFGVDPASCRARRGEVIHTDSGRRLAYRDLAAAAAKEPLPAMVKLKTPSEFELIGTSAKRVDTPPKLDGSARYGIDVRLPGMKFAAVASCPVFGGTLAGVDAAAARAVHGVRDVVRLDCAVAVVADNTWSAFRGLAALRPQWNAGANAAVSSEVLWRDLASAAVGAPAIARNDGDTAKALLGATQRLSAEYRQPFLAHATMEPQNCTVHAAIDACDIWVGTQVPSMAQDAIAKLLGMPASKIRIHNFLIGGGFGRRLEVDTVVLAVRIARHLKYPVKVIWSREEDMRQDFYRPMYLDKMSAGLDAGGRPVAWSQRICGSAVTARYSPPDMKNGVDPDAVTGAIDLPYDFANLRVEFLAHEPRAVPTGWWRGVGPLRNAFVVESFMDELAAQAEQDPVAFRRALLGKAPRARAVLDLAAIKADWSKPLGTGRGRGVSLMSGFGSFLCCIVEASVAGKTPKVDRIVCAVDCGVVVNPDIVRSQLEGGLIFGLSAVLRGEITIRDGRVEQGNFNDYPALRIHEIPAIDVHIAASAEIPGGIGETGTAVLAAAVANAVFAAGGGRIRTLPLRI